MSCTGFSLVQVIRTEKWNQSVMPNAGMKIAFRKGGWEMFREEAPKDHYEATAIYLGHQFAALDE